MLDFHLAELHLTRATDPVVWQVSKPPGYYLNTSFPARGTWRNNVTEICRDFEQAYPYRVHAKS